MERFWKNFPTACAVFAMFFGSGNIVLPLQMGQMFHENWFLPFIGFCLSAVIMPMLGFLGVILCNGNSEEFFSCFNKKISILFQLIILSFNGPLGVSPRCVIVAFGGMQELIPNVNIFYFSFFFLMVVGIFIFNSDNDIVGIIQKFLSPIKITCLLTVIIVGVFVMPSHNVKITYDGNFTNGLLKGYLTMDLCAAIYFSSMLVKHLQKQHAKKSEVLKNGFMVCFISTLLLTIVYLGFSYLAVGYHNQIQNVCEINILPKITRASFGNCSTYVVCLTIIISCVTTAVAFLSSWIDFIKSTWPNNVNLKLLIYCGLIVCYFVSLFGFEKIVNLMQPILNIIYPILIFLSFNILFKHYKKSKSDTK